MYIKAKELVFNRVVSYSQNNNNYILCLQESLAVERAKILARNGCLKDAVTILSRITMGKPISNEPLDLLARIYVQQGKIEDAYDLWEKASERKLSKNNFQQSMDYSAYLINLGYPFVKIYNIVIFFSVIMIILAAILLVVNVIKLAI